MNLPIRDRVILVVVVVCIAVYSFHNLVLVPTGSKIETLSQEKARVQELANDIAPLLEKSNKLEEERNTLRKSVKEVKTQSGGYTATSEEFLLFLGECTAENGVSVTGFNALTSEVNNGIYRSVFDFELQGSTDNINKVLEALDGIGIKSSVGSVSFRQDETYGYLKRFFDEMTNLPWYDEPSEEEIEEYLKQQEELLKQQQEEMMLQPPAEIISSQTQSIPTPTPQPPQTDTPEKPKAIEGFVIPCEPEKQEKEAPIIIQEQQEAVIIESVPENGSIEEEKNLPIVDGISTKATAGLFIVPLTNIEYKEGGQQMRLAVTVCLIMFSEPNDETSFYNYIKGEDDEVF